MPVWSKRINSGEQEYLTPECIASKYIDFFDPCPFPRPEWNGLQVEWGEKAFVNPPFRNVRPWVEKAITESQKGCLVHMLIPPAVSTLAWHELIFPKAQEIIFLRRYVPYVRMQDKTTITLPSCIVIFAKDKNNDVITGNVVKARVSCLEL